MRNPVVSTFSASVGLLAAVVGLGGTAAAQNYESALQARFGTFLQTAVVAGDSSSTVANAEGGAFAYFSKGIGFTTGVDLVNKRGWTFGLEADAAFMDGRTTKLGNQFGVDWILTGRLRAGREIRPNLLWYASTGPALVGYDLVTTVKTQRTRWGWSAGTGLEWDYGGGILFGEYLFAGFGDANFTSTPFSYDVRAHALRVGLKFKVGYEHYYDDVAERIGRRSEN